MKKAGQVFLTAMALMMVISCSRYVAPPFTDVVKVSQLKQSMKIKQVIDVLGIDPYDVYYMQETGGQMFSFNYRLKNRIMYVYTTVNQSEVARQTSNEESQKAGDVYYDKKYHTIFAMFNKDGDLVSYLTTSGAKDKGELIIIGNSIRYYDEKNINVLDSVYNKAHNPLYGGKPINIVVNQDGSFGGGASGSSGGKWYNRVPILRRIF